MTKKHKQQKEEGIRSLDAYLQNHNLILDLADGQNKILTEAISEMKNGKFCISHALKVIAKVESKQNILNIVVDRWRFNFSVLFGVQGMRREPTERYLEYCRVDTQLNKSLDAGFILLQEFENAKATYFARRKKKTRAILKELEHAKTAFREIGKKKFSAEQKLPESTDEEAITLEDLDFAGVNREIREAFIDTFASKGGKATPEEFLQWLSVHGDAGKRFLAKTLSQDNYFSKRLLRAGAKI